MSKGICCAGNMIVDRTYPVEAWPRESELTHITGDARLSTGGAVCNTIVDLARLDPEMPLFASGFAGHDPEGDLLLAELGKYPNINTSMVNRNGKTSFTLVMSNNRSKARTFFQYAGGNADYGEDDIDWERLDVDIFHIGYILLLPHLDEEDAQYGTKMARLLHRVQSMGIRTSVDVVSESGNRYRRIVAPALRYVDYCAINELEAQETTGIPLRDERGNVHRERMRDALEALRALGVQTWCVIHCPELSCGLDENGRYFETESLRLPEGYIQGTVGAGDAFCAGVLYAAEKGLSLPEGLKIGTCAAAASLRSMSATDGVGSAAEVLRLGKRYGA